MPRTKPKGTGKTKPVVDSAGMTIREFDYVRAIDDQHAFIHRGDLCLVLDVGKHDTYLNVRTPSGGRTSITSAHVEVAGLNDKERMQAELVYLLVQMSHTYESLARLEARKVEQEQEIRVLREKIEAQ